MTASILIADDDSISRKVLRRLLEQDGYEVRAFGWPRSTGALPKRRAT